MLSIDQNIFLEELEAELENQLKEVIEVFQNLDEETLLKKSATGRWSIADCLEHLNTYAAFYLPRINRLLEQMQLKPSPVMFKFTWMGRYFINMMDADRSRKKYTSIKKHRPDRDKEPYIVIAEFIHHLEMLQGMVRISRNKELKKGMVSTSISRFIKINLGDAFRFLLVHNRRHLIQAKRYLN